MSRQRSRCSFTVAPCRPGDRLTVMKMLEYVEGMSLEAMQKGIQWEFETFREYLDALDRRPLWVNVAPLIGHSAVRQFVMGEAAWERILDFEDGPIVSGDVRLSPFSSTFDSLATMVIGERVSKTLSWYDNGWGYAHRDVDLIKRFAALERRAA